MSAAAAEVRLLDELYGALADGTRREIVDCLLVHGDLRAGDLARRFPGISRPAVSRHLRVLREAGMLTSRGAGREQWYTVHPGRLQPVAEWLKRYEYYWTDRLALLAEMARELELELAAESEPASAPPIPPASAPPIIEPEGDEGAWNR